VYCAVVCHRVIGMMCVPLFGGVACYKYAVCTVWWCVSVL